MAHCSTSEANCPTQTQRNVSFQHGLDLVTKQGYIRAGAILLARRNARSAQARALLVFGGQTLSLLINICPAENKSAASPALAIALERMCYLGYLKSQAFSNVSLPPPSCFFGH